MSAKEAQTEYNVRFNRKSNGDYFGSIVVEKPGGSLNSEYYRFNVTGGKSGSYEYPLGFEKPEHADRPPVEVYKLAAEKLATLESGTDY